MTTADASEHAEGVSNALSLARHEASDATELTLIKCSFREPGGEQVLASVSGHDDLQCQGMMTFTELTSAPSHPLAPFTNQLRLAVAAAGLGGSR